MIAETLGVFAGGYALLLGGMAMFQRDMIYHPGTESGDPAEAGLPEMVPVPVRTVDNLVITGWYAPPREGDGATIVLFHGNAGTIAHRARKARALLDAGFGVFLAEYRGYGGNPGRPSEVGLYEDCRAVLAWLAARGVPPGRIALYGESLGTGVAVQMATEQDGLAALVLEAPYTSLPELAPPMVPPPMAALLMVDRFEAATKLPHVLVPLLIIHGQQDGVVPVAMGHAMAELAPGEKETLFLPQAGHNDVWDLGGAEAVIDFLRRRTAP